MASAANDAALDNALILQISPEDIEVTERIGLFWPDKAAAIGKLMARDGQNDPIKVAKAGNKAKKPWKLVAGLHRLQGAKLEELVEIDAIEVWGSSEQLKEIEASENLHRRQIGPLERACLVRAIADAAEARMRADHSGLTQQQIAVRARWDAEKAKASGIVPDLQLAEIEADHTGANLSRVYGWREEIAGAMGMSVAAIKRSLALHRAIVAPFGDLYKALAGHEKIAENASALHDIAGVRDAGKRRALIELLLEEPELALAEAMVRLGIKPPGVIPKTGATKFMDGVRSNLQRLSPEQQISIAGDTIEQLKPSALRAWRDALDARIAKIDGESEQ